MSKRVKKKLKERSNCELGAEMLEQNVFEQNTLGKNPVKETERKENKNVREKNVREELAENLSPCLSQDDGIMSDVLGSYTGTSADWTAPEQDADDL